MNDYQSLEFSILIHYKPFEDGSNEFIGIRQGTWDENRNDLIHNFQNSDEKMDVLVYTNDLIEKSEDEIRTLILTELKKHNWSNMTETELKNEINSLFE
ncbi:hypothetical protein [Petrimonas sp.]|uniref:hypothetical protein n=1 Tax=Petrimonas sp. TaxID=2023866 RepID=UPI003F50DE65